MKRGFNRSERVADLIQKTLAQMLLEDRIDERFHFVTITGVTITRDLSYAKVYVSLLIEDKDEIKQMIDALNHVSKSFRHHLAKEVALRTVPELKFIYDESIARGFKISHLIDSAMNNEDNK